MTDREVEPHSSNSQKELPTILRFHVKHQLLGNNGRKTVLKNHPPHNSTTPSYVPRETIGKLIQAFEITTPTTR